VRGVASYAGVALGLSSWLTVGRAGADAERAPLHLTYAAPEGCPSRAEFEGRVQSFLSRSRLNDPAPRFDVTLARESDALARGRLVREETAGDGQAVREVSGATCRDVADLLAFALALSLDPNAAPAEPAAASIDERGTKPARPTLPALPRTPPGVAPSAPEAAPRAADVAVTSWGLALHGALVGANAPSLMYGVGVSGNVLVPLGPLRPSFRLGVEYAAAPSQPEDHGYVAFARVVAIAEGCPTQLGAETLAARVCLRAEGGAHFTAGEGLPGAAPSTRPWFAVGPSAHVRLRIFGPFSLDVAGGVVFPIVRDLVYIGPAQPVYTAPWVGGLGELAVGFAFR
jgi:hypothetical protein